MSFSHLTQAMQSCSFMGETNPVLAQARKGNLECAKGALQEYSALIMGITNLLEGVLNDAHAAQMHGIEDELQRNIHEEEGDLSEDVPHCIIIAEHFGALGLQWPFGELPSIAQWQQMDKRNYSFEESLRLNKQTLQNFSAPTQVFMEQMWKHIQDQPVAFTIGMALALETTAGDELEFVARIVNCILANAGAEQISEGVLNGSVDLGSLPKFSLAGFFAHHIHEWEEGHQGRLEEKIQEEIACGLDTDQLEGGFTTVLALMDTWWAMLAKL
ncbi:MAG: hypothetical protein P8J32_03515 [bacterium]|jgi:hypothetical protein|nr:hypothetical protein [bacterium]